MLEVLNNCVLVASIWIEVAKKKRCGSNSTPPYFSLIRLLHGQQFAVHSVFCCKFCMRPVLYKVSLVHHNNLISITDGLQMVGNDQDCAISDKGRHCLLYLIFIDRVNIARYLVQKNDRSIFEERTSD